MKRLFDKTLQNRKVGWMCLFFNLVILCGSGNLFAQNGEERQFTVKFEKVPVKEVITYLDNHSDYDFLYNNKLIDALPKVSLDVKNASLRAILDFCFKGTNVIYEFQNKLVVLKEKPKKESEVERLSIQGMVVDEKGEVLPGVTILIKGSTHGTASDADGKFKLDYVKAKNVILVFSFISMKTQEVEVIRDGKVLVSDFTQLNIRMKPDTQEVDEVIVTGYANISKKSFTGSVTTINKEQLKTVSPNNIIAGIQMFDPSFRIKENLAMGSNPNALPEMYVRGQSGIGITELDKTDISETSLNSNPNLPTFILDGYEVSVTKVYDLDVNRIESINLLKDAAATAMYGSRAANGVVVITTIAPKPGELVVNYNADIKLSMPDLSFYNLMDARQKLEAEVAAGLFESDDPTRFTNLQKIYNAKLQNIEKGINTDWMALPLRNPLSHKHNIYLEGGVKNMRYGVDLKYDRDNGVMKDSYRETMGFGFTLSYQMDKFHFRNNATYDGMNSRESPYGNYSEIVKMNPYDSYLDEHGRVSSDMKDWHGGGNYRNPVYDATLASFDQTNYREFYNNFDVRWYITSKLNLKANIAFNYKVEETEKFQDPEATFFLNRDIKGDLRITERISSGYDFNGLIYYNDQIDKHNINLAAGVNIKETISKYKGLYYVDFPEGGYSSPDFAKELRGKPTNAYDKVRLFGALFTLNYSFDNIYLADVSMRLDGSSQFGTKKKYAPFASGGLGLNIHNYSFFKERMPWLQQLKVRGSYGMTGKVNFPSYTAQNRFFFETDAWYTTGHAAKLDYMGNPNLEWEKTEIFDIGAELSLCNEAFYMKFTYYRKNTKDLIADMFIPSSSGFTSYKENVGCVENEGIELNLRSKLIGNRDLQLYVFVNTVHNDNRLTKISNSMQTYNERVNEHFTDDPYNNDKPLLKYYEGASLTSIYGMNSLGIDPATGKEYYRYQDGTTGYKWLGNENVVIGDTEPMFNGSFGFNLYYMGFTLDAYFMYEFGGEIYNNTLLDKIERADLTRNCDVRVLQERWKEVGDVKQFKRLDAWKEPTLPTSRFVQDYNWLSLSSISLGYEFPKSLVEKIRLSRLKVQLNASDLFTISSIKMEKGTQYPFARTFNFTLSASF